MSLNVFLYAPPSTPSPNLLQDAGWVGVGVAILIGIATIITTIFITIWAANKQRVRKEITSQILTDLSIISKNPIAEESIGGQVENRLNIVFDGKPVDDLRLVTLKVWNSGNVDAQIQIPMRSNFIFFKSNFHLVKFQGTQLRMLYQSI